ncbi:tRNA 2-thiouridine(34) synthase MnmA [Desulfoplanes formicivorans]|uniref:tRNA-specific 2-thiouridylase MnmA n=1 Tax=Desulfoplanes formicivorans TaxID=1592317 RepID=A0A194AI02_9BACT|nr:tRNA 2-thiouridine(34) synthase MnmA [Desulfoplanes formicivorans]GAU08701.1 tRNA (5-methylaminomethyl-2-thiouridylate)-methyltransferase [Desulfoplanes formicivorans]
MTSIALALSGGADSLLSLALLKEQNAHVFGLHALFLPATAKDLERISNLRTQCRLLGVRLETIDLSDAFEKQIIQPFIRAYTQGKTPNPCAWCNRDMKFGLLFEAARKLGADQLATGHYCRIQPSVAGPGLFRGLDPSKDQSYFLSLVGASAWKQVLFPLGERFKKDVLPALKRRGLNAASEEESQEICFIPDNYRSFLSSRGILLPGPGPVVTREGKQIGTHQGLWRYTQGQRRGLKIAYAHPLYVIDKDIRTNTLIVGSRDQLWASTCTAIHANIMVPPAHWPEHPLVQTRYRQQAGRARVRLVGKTLEVEFITPQEVPTPGQVLTVYSREGQVLAGGIIV